MHLMFLYRRVYTCSSCLFFHLCAVLGEITTNPRNLTIPYGKIALFECAAADSVPKATITWYKDSVRLSPNNNLSEGTGSVMGFSDFTGTLFIREVEKSDEGLYHCTAENARGTLTSQTAVLTVDSCKDDYYVSAIRVLCINSSAA